MTDRQAIPLPRSVLIVAGIEDGPFRYRVANLVEELKLLGIPATVLFHHDEQALQAAGEHELVFFQRVPGDEYVARLVARALGAAALPVFGIDDLLFEPERLPTFVADLPRDERSHWAETVRSYRRVFDACDAFVGATDVLQHTAASLGKKSFVHRNALSQELIDLSNAAKGNKPSDGLIRFGYFSGTRTHTRDFATIGPALAKVLGARPQVRLELVGPVELPPDLRRFSHRIDRRPAVPWKELPALLARVDVNLVPLDTHDRFCQAKSELKWFEAAAAGVPTIASPTEPYRTAVRDGKNGMLAEGADQWESRLLALVDEPALRERLAQAAGVDAIASHGPRASAKRLEETLRALVALRPRGRLRPGPRISGSDLAALKASGLGIGRAAVEPGDGVRGPQQLATRYASEAILGTVTARQTFTCPSGMLYRIDLLVGTYRRFNSHDVILRIVDTATGEQLAFAAANAGEACDNAWFAIEIEPPVSSESPRDLTLLIEAPAAPPGEGLGLWYETSPSGRGRVGAKNALDLAFRTWLRPAGWTPGELPREVLGPDGLATPEAVRRLTDLLREEKEARRELERRLARVEERAAAAQLAARRQQTPTVSRFARLRGTLPYRAARKLYRLLKP